MKRSSVYRLVEMALYASLFVVLDAISNQIGFFKMPNGGTIGISTVVLLVASYRLGYRRGIVVALLTLPLQGMFAPFYFVNLLDFFFEYILAFGVYGLASLVPNTKHIHWGIVLVNLVRLGIHTLAGVWFWETTWWGSLSYNAWYMIPTLLVGLVVVPPILKRLPK